MCAFTIPNEADVVAIGGGIQAEPEKVDIDILVAGLNGNGVVSGCAVTAQVTPDMTTAVAGGTIRNADGTTATVTAGNVTHTTADATNARFDLVGAGNTGTKAVTAGTAAASPVFPAIPANGVIFAAVYVPANDTAIASNQITDKRVVLATAGFAGQELDYVEYTSNVSVTATTEGTADTVVTGTATVFSAAPVMIEFFAPYAVPQATAAALLWFVLYEDGASIGLMGAMRTPASTNQDNKPVLLRRRHTPTAASHTYSIRSYTSTGTGTVAGNTGGSGVVMPGYIRITKI